MQYESSKDTEGKGEVVVDVLFCGLAVVPLVPFVPSVVPCVPFVLRAVSVALVVVGLFSSSIFPPSTSVWFLIGFSVVVVVVTPSWRVISLLVATVVNLFLVMMSLQVCLVLSGPGHCSWRATRSPVTSAYTSQQAAFALLNALLTSPPSR